MKKIIFLILFPILSNFSTNAQNLNPKDSITLKNVSYGNSDEQIIDIYLPADRNSKTKTFVLLHGGAWLGGSKSSMIYLANSLKAAFPNYAIINVNYRLATSESLGFPKQIEDIDAVFEHLKLQQPNYKISNDFAFVAKSAGSHLAMLYSYGFDKNKNIKAICDIAGPVDFTDPAYTLNRKFNASQLKTLLGGNINFIDNPEIFIKASPAHYLSKKAPKTIMFYGANDLLVPKSQGEILKEKLDKFGVYNELYIYENERHSRWSKGITREINQKMHDFFRKNF